MFVYVKLDIKSHLWFIIFLFFRPQFCTFVPALTLPVNSYFIKKLIINYGYYAQLV